MKFFRKKPAKIFVIGRNKTGTTSMAEALAKAGFIVGKQSKAESMAEDWVRRDFSRIIQYCKTADAFQDVPFSLPYTYQAVDQAFPGSRFILTMRDSSDQWFESVKRFHTMLLGHNRLPTVNDLKEFPHIYKGWLWRQQQVVYGADESTLYDRSRYIAQYEKHNADVQEYFRFRQKDLLVLNLSEPSAQTRLAVFLGLPVNEIDIPHVNRSA